MALAAAQVIDAIAARLVPMVATGGRVYTSRTWPLGEADLPAWRVTAEGEDVTRATIDGLNDHSLVVRARAAARATSDIDDTLHALAASGLALLFADPVPYGLQLERIDRDLSTEGEAAVGVISLDMRAQFFVAPATPETIFS
jgi:hypothetical protein